MLGNLMASDPLPELCDECGGTGETETRGEVCPVCDGWGTDPETSVTDEPPDEEEEQNYLMFIAGTDEADEAEAETTDG
jgi:RecJ-like exonuclease